LEFWLLVLVWSLVLGICNFMSRIGKKPIQIPAGVEVKIEGNKVIVKGPKGELSREIRPEIKIEVSNNQILVSSQIETKQTKALWGLTRALVANMAKGVAEGFRKQLEIQGIGFRAVVEGEDLVLYVGYSHPVKVKAPMGVQFSVEKNIITVSGFDLEAVSQTASRIRKAKPPEPYKGKGIRYVGEYVRKKLGKKAVTTG